MREIAEPLNLGKLVNTQSPEDIRGGVHEIALNYEEFSARAHAATASIRWRDEVQKLFDEIIKIFPETLLND